MSPKMSCSRSLSLPKRITAEMSPLFRKWEFDIKHPRRDGRKSGTKLKRRVHPAVPSPQHDCEAQLPSNYHDLETAPNYAVSSRVAEAVLP
ncbi:hypothetical protein CEXT_437601 [Caerostris extrusa]|uniref:Uncharacterized protein n=1 Tax=Caerostris extrusa TaxID=172846 RepID=A0AAV4U8X5_CAEEX|nr:hypothetical protein CEXT_437601 [Caerostris extrusa]